MAGTILDVNDDDLDFAFDLNVRSMVRTIRAVLPGMLERGDGAIINMSSVAGSVKGVPNRFVYGDQGGRDRPDQVGRRRYVGKGIRCNAICPGTVESPVAAGAPARPRRL